MMAMALVGLSCGAMAQDIDKENKDSADVPKEFPSPNAIVDSADASEWVAIKASDLMVMDLAPDRDGKARRVIIQLMPEPFSQGWVRNIRKLTAAKFWDDTAIIRVQDNYVTQWGDPNADGEGAKALPDGLEVVPESEYTEPGFEIEERLTFNERQIGPRVSSSEIYLNPDRVYAKYWTLSSGWPMAGGEIIKDGERRYWPVHCYAMVGVGRDLSPDTGDGSSLYTVIGHAPRHLDRNIALVGRIISGMEHMSSLPRGTGTLGFYETPEERTTIISVRLGSEVADVPSFEYLSTESKTFLKYIDARANRRDPFFNVPAGGADICNIPIPIREQKPDKTKDGG